jgi:hypothetical protein
MLDGGDNLISSSKAVLQKSLQQNCAHLTETEQSYFLFRTRTAFCAFNLCG